ncbi:BA75_03962T0 [Komagataella pastoris]|uniref:BA75_03962T0 n=1 Tax=Komagataella pastoris TaxID=4922 RepID=A0A1B2JFN7_PICPA|nr:BA75_03962T0 [Komagataella pastoris]
MSFFHKNSQTIKTRGFKTLTSDIGLPSTPETAPKTEQQPSTTHRDIKNYAEATLGSGSSLAQAVKLPIGEDLDEWLAVHVVSFYNQINMLYGTITEFCSAQSCPRMIATQEYEYLWQPSISSRTSNMGSASGSSSPRKLAPVSCTAPEYVENLMSWVQDNLDDERIFPNKTGVPFPTNFQPLVRTMMKRLFRVYAHIYCHHFDEIAGLSLQAHLNTSFKHFVLFCKEFRLISTKDYGPLKELVLIMFDDNELDADGDTDITDS